MRGQVDDAPSRGQSLEGRLGRRTAAQHLHVGALLAGDGFGADSANGRQPDRQSGSMARVDATASGRGARARTRATFPTLRRNSAADREQSRGWRRFGCPQQVAFGFEHRQAGTALDQVRLVIHRERSPRHAVQWAIGNHDHVLGVARQRSDDIPGQLAQPTTGLTARLLGAGLPLR